MPSRPLNRLVGAGVSVVLMVGTAACSAGGQAPQAPPEPVTVLFDQGRLSASLQKAPEHVPVEGLVLVIGGSPADDYVAESRSLLAEAGYASLVIEGAEDLGPLKTREILAAAAADTRGDPVPQAVLAFGPSGDMGWSLSSGDVGVAFLVSCPLPEGAFDFESLKNTSVRAVFAQDRDVYRTSYERAHVPMRDIPTPHDFLVYGNGITDDFYDRSSTTFHEATWNATRDSMIEWFDLFLGGRPGPSGDHRH